MAIFPRFVPRPSAIVAIVAKVGVGIGSSSRNFRKFRNFRNPEGSVSGRPSEPDCDLAAHFTAFNDAWCERFALIVEGGDVSEVEARRIADAELGAAFRLRFMPNER
jgi:hypothetical protein